MSSHLPALHDRRDDGPRRQGRRRRLHRPDCQSPDTRHGQSLEQAFDRYRADDSGLVADYIPGSRRRRSRPVRDRGRRRRRGEVHTVGDAAVEFSIQSISKAFVFALVDEALGHETVL